MRIAFGSNGDTMTGSELDYPYGELATGECDKVKGGPGSAPCSTGAIVVSLTNAVNLPIRLTIPSVASRNMAFDG